MKADMSHPEEEPVREVEETIHKFFSFPIIDFHVHLFPDRFFDAIWEFFRREYQWNVEYRLYTPQIIRFLRDRGVERIVFSNYAHKAGVASVLNAWNLDLLDEEENLYCFAAFHPDDGDYMEEVRRLLQHPRILGFKLQLLVQRFYPHDERLFPLYEAVIEAKKRILMHVGTGPIGNDFVGIKHLRKLLKRYPELAVNVPHMGVLEVPQFLELLDEYPAIYLDTAFVFFPSPVRGHTITPEDLIGHQGRIIYGSDFPNLIFKWDTEIQTLRNFGLPDGVYRKIFYENGLRLLGSN